MQQTKPGPSGGAPLTRSGDRESFHFDIDDAGRRKVSHTRRHDDGLGIGIQIVLGRGDIAPRSSPG